jgi:hypothetical protein
MRSAPESLAVLVEEGFRPCADIFWDLGLFRHT